MFKKVLIHTRRGLKITILTVITAEIPLDLRLGTLSYETEWMTLGLVTWSAMCHKKDSSRPGRMMYIIENMTASGNTTIRKEYLISLLNTKAFPGAASLHHNYRYKL